MNMKKILLSLFFGLLFVGSACALQINSIYSVQASTNVITSTTTTTAQIDLPSVRIKGLTITNGGTAQTVTIYENANSTITINAVATFDVPASTVFYAFPDILTDEENFNVPYFAVRTSTSTNAARVTVLYK